MSGDSDGDVGIVLDNPAIHPMEEMAAAGQSYKDKFESILTAFDDERTWWDAVDDLLDKDGDFADKVSHRSAFLHARRILQSSRGVHHILLHMQVATKAQAERVESRQQAIVEVMVDLLLEVEGITVHQGLVYVLDKLESFPVSGKVEQGMSGVM